MGEIELPGPIGEWTLKAAASGADLWFFPLNPAFSIIVLQDRWDRTMLWTGHLRTWFGVDISLEVSTVDLTNCKWESRLEAAHYFRKLADLAELS